MIYKVDKQTILDDILKLINKTSSNNGSEFEGTIDANNLLGADLGFGSIDVVRLILNIQKKYQKKDIPFQDFFIKDDTVVLDVKIADLVDFIYKKLSE